MTLTRQACIIQDNPGQGTKMVFMVCMEHALILNMPCNRITDFLWIKKYMTDLVLMLHIVPRSEQTGARERMNKKFNNRQKCISNQLIEVLHNAT